MYNCNYIYNIYIYIKKILFNFNQLEVNNESNSYKKKYWIKGLQNNV